MLPSSKVLEARERACRSNSAALVIRVRSSVVFAGAAALCAGAASGRRIKIGLPHFRQVALLTSRVSLESGIL
jgi:hypothetical protein